MSLILKLEVFADEINECDFDRAGRRIIPVSLKFNIMKTIRDSAENYDLAYMQRVLTICPSSYVRWGAQYDSHLLHETNTTSVRAKRCVPIGTKKTSESTIEDLLDVLRQFGKGSEADKVLDILSKAREMLKLMKSFD